MPVAMLHNVVRLTGSPLCAYRLTIEPETLAVLSPNGAQITAVRILLVLPRNIGPRGTLRAPAVQPSAKPAAAPCCRRACLRPFASRAYRLLSSYYPKPLKLERPLRPPDWRVEKRLFGDPRGQKTAPALRPRHLRNPDLLFLTSPPWASTFARRGLWTHIRALERGAALLTTHLTRPTRWPTDAVIDQGRIIAQGTPAEIKQPAPPPAWRTPSFLVRQMPTPSRRCCNDACLLMETRTELLKLRA
jgi:hypothetical protein